METQDNRWSCKPALGPSGSSCSITYSLEDSLDIVGLNVGVCFTEYSKPERLV